MVPRIEWVCLIESSVPWQAVVVLGCGFLALAGIG